MERTLASLERRFGKHMPDHLAVWIVGLSFLGFMAVRVAPPVYELLILDPGAVLHGQIWRVFTFLFVPPATGSGAFGLVFLIVFFLFLYQCADALEQAWGTFRFFCFYGLGAAATVAASLILAQVMGAPATDVTNHWLNSSIFFGWAALVPDAHVLLFMIVPVRARWLGVIELGYMVWGFIGGTLESRVTIAIALANAMLFCGERFWTVITGQTGPRPLRPRVAREPGAWDRPVHRVRVCALCGKSDAQDRTLEFRICDCQAKCGGKPTEYCIEHARNH